jgi:histidinol-phosphatase (PHP family)
VADDPAEDSGLHHDAHLHTDLSPDSGVPVDAYCAEAVRRSIPTIAITDHVDFDPLDPAYRYTDFATRERTVRDAAERWAGEGLRVVFGVEITYGRRWEADIRDHLARHRYDYVIGSVHDWPGSPYRDPRSLSAWMAGRSLAEIVGPHFGEVAAAARSGLFDTIGHIDVVKRYVCPRVSPAELAAAPELYEPVLSAMIEAGAGLEINTSGLRQAPGEPYPPPPIVALYRAMGGRAVTIGSDAHRLPSFAEGLRDASRSAVEAGLDVSLVERQAAAIST